MEDRRPPYVCLCCCLKGAAITSLPIWTERQNQFLDQRPRPPLPSPVSGRASNQVTADLLRHGGVVSSERLFEGHSTFLLWLWLLLLLFVLCPVRRSISLGARFGHTAMVGTSFTSSLLWVQEFIFSPFVLRHFASSVAFHLLDLRGVRARGSHSILRLPAELNSANFDTSRLRSVTIAQY